MNLSFRIALRHLKAPQKAGFTRYAGIMAMTGLGLGIAALILTFSILEGFERTLSNKLTEFDGHIRIEHFMDAPMPQDDPLLDSALAALTVDFRSTAYIQKAAILRSGQQAEGVLVEAYPDRSVVPGLSKLLIAGEELHSDNDIIIGRELAESLGLEIGDKLVLFDISNLHQVASQRRLGQYRISGLFHSGLEEYDQTLVYLTFSSAQNLFAMDQQISGHVLYLSDPAQVGMVSSNLEGSLNYPYFILSWIEKHRILFNWLSVQKWPILIIFGMITLVGVVNIISALTMIVLEKIREIGTLKSMGLSRRVIRQVFLMEGGIIGFLGSAGGALSAGILAYFQDHFKLFSIPEEVYFMDHVPVHLELGTVIGFIIAGVVAAVLAALWPTLKAAAIKPAEALRYE